jgi:hypothetical protein
MMRDRVPAADAPRDAAPVPVPVPVPDAAPPADAAVPADAPPPDAAIDAGIRVITIRPDAGRPSPRDAAIVTARPDAAVTAPAGSGLATIKYAPGTYANISIDGAPAEPGPIYKRKLAAGPHHVKFLDPKTGAVLDEQSFTVRDGDTVEVRQK